PLGLHIGAELAAYARTFIRIDAEPVQHPHHRLDRAGHQPFAVGVLDAHDECGALLGEPGSPGPPYRVALRAFSTFLLCPLLACGAFLGGTRLPAENAIPP